MQMIAILTIKFLTLPKANYCLFDHLHSVKSKITKPLLKSLPTPLNSLPFSVLNKHDSL